MKVLVIGLGSIGQRHVRNLRTLLGDRVDIIAWRVRGLSHLVTANLRSDATRDVAREYGIRVFDTLERALAQKPQIAFICNPNSLHVPAAVSCIRAGCDVFLEKPVSHNMDGLDELLAEVNRSERIVMVGYQFRFHPCFLALRELLQSGKLGPLLAARATIGEYLPGWHPYEDYRQAYASRSDLGGGVIVSQIHEFDYLYALFGAPRRLFSVGGHWSHLDLDVEDIASTLIEFQWSGRPLPVHLHQDYLQRPATRTCEVIGANGKVQIDLLRPSLTRFDANGMPETMHWDSFDRNQLFLDELRHFLECVETRQKPLVELHDGIWSLRMGLVARQSIASGEVIDFGAAARA